MYFDIIQPSMQSDAFSWVHTVTEREVFTIQIRFAFRFHSSYKLENDFNYPFFFFFFSFQDVSCFTIIAENFATTSPEILAGKGFSRLLVHIHRL